jgi:Domain of Unknown Function (DUF748)
MPRWWVWLVGAVVLLAVAAVVGSFVLAEPLRRYAEQHMNARLQGYTVRIGALDVHPLGLSMDVQDVVIVQQAYPDPPVLRLPKLSARVQGRALLSARVVADVQVERPAIHLSLPPPRSGVPDAARAGGPGWQQALQAVYPFTINELRVVEGEVSYLDDDPARPLRLSHLHGRAQNIRNRKSPAGEYPTDLHVEGVLCDSGTLALDGQADVLAVPHAAVKAQLTLEHVDLSRFQAVARRHHIALRQGVLSAAAALEYAPTVQIVHLHQADVQGLQLDYVHTAQTTPANNARAQPGKRAAQEVRQAPGIVLRADRVSVVQSQIGFVNRAAAPAYRLFLAEAEVHLTNFSNQLTEGTAVAKVTGNFMGSGRTVVGASFRPATQGPDFALAASIEHTDMRALNELLRAYGTFDVVQGVFSLYTELRVRHRAVRGYVQPVLRDLDVYDPRQDQEKSLFQKLYEAAVGGVGEVLEHLPRPEAATKADVAGLLENPQAGTWQALVDLMPRAFFKAILPAFERGLGRPRR